MPLTNKHIIVAVTGGIAAYKAADLCSRLLKTGADVRVAMSPHAARFVAPLTFEALTGHPVYSHIFHQPQSYEMEHVTWSRWADLLIIAPATADAISRLAAGAASDPVSTLYLCFQGPVVIAPAMNTRMWNHPATSRNVDILIDRGVRVMHPGEGNLACGETGPGRMPEPQQIIHAITEIPIPPRTDTNNPSSADTPRTEASRQTPPDATASGHSSHFDNPDTASATPRPTTPRDTTLAGKTVLITSGPTREYIDPIRYISNPSSGRMGAALAREALDRSANVIFITGPVENPQKPDGTTLIEIETAEQMLDAVRHHATDADIIIFAAAVGDFRPPETIPGKIKRSGNSITLSLIENPDIAQVIGHAKRPGQITIGFAAETDNILDNAATKLKRKHLDAIVANDITQPGIGFQSPDNEVTIIQSDGTHTPVTRRSKPQIAKAILDTATYLQTQNP